MNKERIREYALSLGVDDVGFAAAVDYKSPRSPQLTSLMPEIKALVVLAYREPSNCESPNPQIAMTGRMDLMEFSRSTNYRLAGFIERLGGKTMTISASYPLEMTERTMGSIGEVSLRHAAVAAGLGNFGRHNIVIHPRLGTRVIFTALLTALEITSDPPVSDSLCTNCDACVSSCPAGALNEPGKTDVAKCLRKSQPYGIGGSIKFWSKFVEAEQQEEKKNMLLNSEYWRLHQAGSIGFQYFCFNCLKSCPIGQQK
jgi:epoxyqueuosine reductase QueG